VENRSRTRFSPRVILSGAHQHVILSGAHQYVILSGAR
jgi:hypothetical protein